MTSHLTESVAACIAACGGNAMRTARMLGISHRAFMYWAGEPAIAKLLTEARAGRPQQSMEELLLAAPLGAIITLRRYQKEWAVTMHGQTYRHASVHRALADALAEVLAEALKE